MTTEQNDFSAFAPPALIVKDRQSLIHLGSLDSFDITEGGKQAARLILDFLDGASPETLEQAIQIYEEIIPNENFGGEYTALEWMCKYFLADETRREAMRAQPMIDSFQRMMTDSDCDNLRTYLQYKYHILEYGPGDQTALKARMRFLEDFILFSNPDRERWETTRDNLEKINLKNESEIYADYFYNENQEYTVECVIKERRDTLIDLKLNVTSKALARSICDNWRAKSTDVYQFLINELWVNSDNENTTN